MNEFVLKNRDYLLLFVGSAVSNLGTHIYNFAISLYIYVVTDGNAAIAGIYLATGGVVYFIMSPFAGAITDRLDKVKVVYMTDLINGISVLLAGFFLFGSLSNTTIIVLLFVVTIILGINGSLFNPAAGALPRHILEENQLQQSSSLSQGMFALYGIVGAAIGGILYGLLDIELIFLINGFSFLLSGMSEMFIRTKTKEDDDHVLTFKGTLIDIKEGVAYVFTLKPIFWLVAIASLLNFATIPTVVNALPYMFEVLLDVEAYYLSILMATFPVGIIITSIILGSRPQKDKVSPLILRGLLGMAIAFVLVTGVTYLLLEQNFPFIWYMIISIIALLITGMFNGSINIPFNVAIQLTVDKDKLGRVSSVIGIISSGMTPIAIALGGVVIEYFGVMILFYIATGGMFLVSFLAYNNKYIKQL